MGKFGEFLDFFCNSYPLPLLLLGIIIFCALYWYFKERPKRQKEALEKEERDRERDRYYTEILIKQEESSKTTLALYEKALENSTRAIENNTEVIRVFSERMKKLEEASEVEMKVLQDLQSEDRKLIEKAIELNILLRKKED